MKWTTASGQRRHEETTGTRGDTQECNTGNWCHVCPRHDHFGLISVITKYRTAVYPENRTIPMYHVDIKQQILARYKQADMTVCYMMANQEFQPIFGPDWGGLWFSNKLHKGRRACSSKIERANVCARYHALLPYDFLPKLAMFQLVLMSQELLNFLSTDRNRIGLIQSARHFTCASIDFWEALWELDLELTCQCTASYCSSYTRLLLSISCK